MRDPRARGRLPRGPNSHVENTKVSDSATAFKQGAMEAPEDDGKENAPSKTQRKRKILFSKWRNRKSSYNKLKTSHH